MGLHASSLAGTPAPLFVRHATYRFMEPSPHVTLHALHALTTHAQAAYAHAGAAVVAPVKSSIVVVSAPGGTTGPGGGGGAVGHSSRYA